ncbi:hypothetical protein FHT21_001178 [Pedobacter sp. SG908]|nr:hypothetical protein [Pedobacter sp. SG908]
MSRTKIFKALTEVHFFSSPEMDASQNSFIKDVERSSYII